MQNMILTPKDFAYYNGDIQLGDVVAVYEPPFQLQAALVLDIEDADIDSDPRLAVTVLSNDAISTIIDSGVSTESFMEYLNLIDYPPINVQFNQSIRLETEEKLYAYLDASAKCREKIDETIKTFMEQSQKLRNFTNLKDFLDET